MEALTPLAQMLAPAKHHHKKPAQSPGERKLRRALSVKRYAESPRGKFNQQKFNAKVRHVPWELTYAQWCELWDASGKWEERGTFVDGYVMCRKGDQGAYAMGNVYIGRHIENVAERNALNPIRKRWADPGDDWRHVHSAPDVTDDVVPF